MEGKTTGMCATISDMQQRLAAIEKQLDCQKELNERFGTGYSYLLQVIEFGRKEERGEKRLSDDEFLRYKDVNDRANAAKHEGLGAEGAEGDDKSFAVADGAGHVVLPAGELIITG